MTPLLCSSAPDSFLLFAAETEIQSLTFDTESTSKPIAEIGGLQVISVIV